MILKGHGAVLRIPETVRKNVAHLIEPSKKEFDTRMYRATKSGRARLRKANS
jgi:hypothetical protein